MFSLCKALINFSRTIIVIHVAMKCENILAITVLIFNFLLLFTDLLIKLSAAVSKQQIQIAFRNQKLVITVFVLSASITKLDNIHGTINMT